MKFSLVMMCSSCKWRITEALKAKGFINFDIDMETSTLTFKDKVNPERVIQTVNGIGYKCDYIQEDPILDNFDNLTDEQIMLIEEALKNGESLEELDFLFNKE